MKLSLAAFFLGTFFLTLKCPNTSASEVRTRRPKKFETPSLFLASKSRRNAEKLIKSAVPKRSVAMD